LRYHPDKVNIFLTAHGYNPLIGQLQTEIPLPMIGILTLPRFLIIVAIIVVWWIQIPSVGVS